MQSEIVGQTAALVTAFLWTTCSIFFASAGRRIGALAVNGFRIVLAIVLLGAAHLVLQGVIVPAATREQWIILAVSGVLGLSLGDFCYFRALVLIGPRRGVLLISMAPIFTTIFAYLTLGEKLAPLAFAGIALALGGVAIVILERDEQNAEDVVASNHKARGVALGLAGALGQGLGLGLSKYGMVAAGGGALLNPLSAALMRMVAGAIFLWLLIAISGRLPGVMRTLHDLGAVVRTASGAVTGPFLGMWMSMIAVRNAQAGVAATLMALMPVLIVPYLWVIYRQRTSKRGIAGAVIAVAGVAILFLR